MSGEPVLVKICGLSTPQTLDATIAAGADLAGFVFFAKSPRHIDLDAARALGEQAAGRIQKVALTVDADDAALAEVVAALRPDMLQLHGHESLERVSAVKARFGLPVIKAIGVEQQPVGDAEPAQAMILDAAMRRATNNAVNLIALLQQKLREIRAVLSGDACNKRALGHHIFLFLLALIHLPERAGMRQK